MLKMKPTSQIIARLGIEPNGPAQKFFCNECYRYMAPFVPGGINSHLNQNVIIAKNGSSVTYLGPDAHYLFNGILYVDPKYEKGAFFNSDYGFWSRPGITKIPSERQLKYHAPGTGAHWDKLMWTSKGEEVIANVQRFVERGCKQ